MRQQSGEFLRRAFPSVLDSQHIKLAHLSDKSVIGSGANLLDQQQLSVCRNGRAAQAQARVSSFTEIETRPANGGCTTTVVRSAATRSRRQDGALRTIQYRK
jgi:hypothetical protein